MFNREQKQDGVNKEIKRKPVIIISIISLFLFLIITIYLIGYQIGTIGVSADIMAQLDVIKITSNCVEWNNSKELSIFNNGIFSNKNMIAPNLKGTYKFIVQNTSSENIRYNISFLEENKHNVNMKYRLKIDNIYVVGGKDNWEDITGMNIEDILITNNSKTMYTIEWYWEESENDTQIGKKEYAEYKLYIRFTPFWQGSMV